MEKNHQALVIVHGMVYTVKEWNDIIMSKN